VSQQAAEAESRPERVVRNRSQHASSLHRLDPDADEPRPACPESDCRPDAEFTVDEICVYTLEVYSLCDNPECFGRAWR